MKARLTLLLLLFGFTACLDIDELESIESVQYDAEFALPIADSRQTIRNILESTEDLSTIIIDPDGLLRFRYFGDVLMQTSEDVFGSLDDFLPPVIPLTDTVTALPLDLPGEVDLDLVDFDQGKMIYYFENPFEQPLRVELSFPQILSEGMPLTIEDRLPPYSGSGPPPAASNENDPSRLEAFQLIPENDSIIVRYEAILGDGQRVRLDQFLLQFDSLGFSYAEGYLGQQIFEGGRDTIELDFFENSYLGGSIFFADPTITFFVDNSFGIPSRSVINAFEVLTVTGESIPVESPLIEEGVDFPYPGLDEVGRVAMDSFIVNAENSNLEDVLSAGPVAIDYDVDVLTNPEGDTEIIGFVTDSSFYSIQAEADLPLVGQVDNFLARDTFDLEIAQFEEIQSIEFKIVAENSAPLDMDMQIYVLDEQGQFLDSLLVEDQRVLLGAPVDDEGVATAPVSKTTFVPIEEERLDGIRTGTILIFQASISTENNTGKTVKVFADQGFQLQMGALVRLINDE